MSERHELVAARAGRRCEYCRAPEELANFPFPVDHVVPRSVAPELVDDLENLALACLACNLHKGARTTSADPATGARTRLFHPRRDLWHEHFGWTEPGLEVVGRTPIGRATVAALRMNSAFQRAARARWLSHDLFP